MGDKSKIEWCDATWNPVTGCTKVSQGCKNCYAEGVANRFWGRRKFTDIQLHELRLDQPLRWRKPRRIFVNSMSDLFHEDVPDKFIGAVWSKMLEAPRHTFMILTKRPERMLDVVTRLVAECEKKGLRKATNIYLGVSVETQKEADERIPLLLQTPAAVRFVSCEPLLGPVDLGLNAATCNCCERTFVSRWVKIDQRIIPEWPIYPVMTKAIVEPGIYRAGSNPHGALHVETENGDVGIKPGEFECLPKLDWVIVGGESGPHARPMHPVWAQSIRDQCLNAGVPFFFKQWGEWRCNYFDTPAESEGWYPERVGKKAAGRMLDGCEWNEFPKEVGE